MSQVRKVGAVHFTLIAPTMKSEEANAPSAPRFRRHWRQLPTRNNGEGAKNTKGAHLS